MLVSCGKEQTDPTVNDPIVGDWHCTSTAIDAEIYVTFNADKTFVLYQQIGEGAYRVYNGKYNVEGPGAEGGSVQTLTGTYNDGTNWGSGYEMVMGEDGTMTLTASGITETYNKLTDGIPAAVLASSVTVVKSEDGDWKPFL